MGIKSMMLLLALALAPIHSILADTPSAPDWLSAEGPCPILLTEAECHHFRLTYATRTNAAEREALLRLLYETVLEREAACACLRAEMSTSVHARDSTQRF